jgi:hypothetical protein
MGNWLNEVKSTFKLDSFAFGLDIWEFVPLNLTIACFDFDEIWYMSYLNQGMSILQIWGPRTEGLHFWSTEISLLIDESSIIIITLVFFL